MAHMIPSMVPAEAPSSERRVAECLARLPQSWWVLHGVAWQSCESGRPRDGEADFVLLNREQGLVILEVKGGRIELESGYWYSIDRHDSRHPIKNPFLQAVSSKHALVRYLKHHDSTARNVPASHGVVFPDLRNPGTLGPIAPENLSIGTDDFADIETAIQRLTMATRSDTPLTDRQLQHFVDLLAPTRTVKPLLADTVERVNSDLLRLTNQQIAIMQQTRRNHRSLIFGGAGTGKTVLAIERSRQLARDGFRVLLTCFNRPLGDHLCAAVADCPNVRAVSFHRLCVDEAVRARLALPNSKSNTYFDDTFAERLEEAAAINDTRFDALVIDEAQDFKDTWFTALQLLLNDPDNDPIYLFSDSQQAIYRPEWKPPFLVPAFDLDINCRNTIQIARRVDEVFGGQTQSLGAQGPEPEFIEVNDSPAELHEAVRVLVHRLIVEERLRPQQIIILSASKQEVEQLRAMSFGGKPCCVPGGDGIAVETVHRFKGLEADAAILHLSSIATNHERALAYIGMSRARTALFVLGPFSVIQDLNGSA